MTRSSQRIAQRRISVRARKMPGKGSERLGIKRAEPDGLPGALSLENEKTGFNLARGAGRVVRGEAADLLRNCQERAVGNDVFGGGFSRLVRHRVLHAAGGIVDNRECHAILVGGAKAPGAWTRKGQHGQHSQRSNDARSHSVTHSQPQILAHGCQLVHTCQLSLLCPSCAPIKAKTICNPLERLGAHALRWLDRVRPCCGWSCGHSRGPG